MVKPPSAGLLLFRSGVRGLEVLLAHPGGPFWARKDDGAWTIPKGQIEVGEEPLDAARREFQEETGQAVDGEFLPLQPVRQGGGKVVHAWAVRGDFDVTKLTSQLFEMEWPPRSGRMQAHPEVDRAEWFTVTQARRKILRSQAGLLDQLEEMLRVDQPPGAGV